MMRGNQEQGLPDFAFGEGTVGEAESQGTLELRTHEQEGRTESRQDTTGLSWGSLRRCRYTSHLVFSFSRAQDAQTCLHHQCALFTPPVGADLELRRFCIQMRILSVSGNPRTPGSAASSFLQNDCRLGRRGSCLQRTHTMPCCSDVAYVFIGAAICASDKGTVSFCPHNSVPQLYNLKPEWYSSMFSYNQ